MLAIVICHVSASPNRPAQIKRTNQESTPAYVGKPSCRDNILRTHAKNSGRRRIKDSDSRAEKSPSDSELRYASSYRYIMSSAKASTWTATFCLCGQSNDVSTLRNYTTTYNPHKDPTEKPSQKRACNQTRRGNIGQCLHTLRGSNPDEVA